MNCDFGQLIQQYQGTITWAISGLLGIIALIVLGAYKLGARASTETLSSQASRIEAFREQVQRLERDLERANQSRALRPGVDLERGTPEDRALTLASEIRELQRMRDAAESALRAERERMTDAEWALDTSPQERYGEALTETATLYRRLKPQAIAVRDQLLPKVPREVIRARADVADQAYEGHGIYSRYEDIAMDLELLARARQESQ